MKGLWNDDCPFCKRVLAVEGKPYKNCFYFEPLNPVTPGHMLFVSRYHLKHGDSEDYVGAVFAAAAWWATQQGKDYNLITSSGPAATQTIAHVHVHYVPRTPSDGLTLPWTGQNHA